MKARVFSHIRRGSLLLSLIALSASTSFAQAWTASLACLHP